MCVRTHTTHSLACSLLDCTQAKSEWSLPEGFVAEEGHDLLPPKTVYRTNLIDCYQALLLAILKEDGLLDVSVPQTK